MMKIITLYLMPEVTIVTNGSVVYMMGLRKIT